MKKGMMVLLCIAMAGTVLGGCASRRASGTTATAAPIVTNSPAATMGAATIAPDMSPDMNAGAAAGMQAGSTAGSMTGTTDTMDNSLMNERSAQSTGMTPAEAGRTAEKIAEAVERISEIDDAQAVVDQAGRVLVAVEFDDQYSAGLDERMKKMIADAVQQVDANLKDVEITDDSTLYGQVKSLGERIAKATGLDEMADDFGDLWDRITGM